MSINSISVAVLPFSVIGFAHKENSQLYPLLESVLTSHVTLSNLNPSCGLLNILLFIYELAKVSPSLQVVPAFTVMLDGYWGSIRFVLAWVLPVSYSLWVTIV